MFLHVIQAKYIEDYKIEVLFNDGKKGVANLVDVLNKGIFQSLQDKKKFSSFIVDKDLETVVWSNGVDLAPEYIYFQAFKKNLTLKEKFKEWGYIT